MEKPIITLQAVIKGRVQGVWFRAWTVEEAEKLRLSGWVRNRADGSVEALFQGPKDHVDQMVLRCRKGPLLARVDAVDTKQVECPQSIGFSKRQTL